MHDAATTCKYPTHGWQRRRDRVKAAVVSIFVLLAGMLFVTPVAAARSGSPAWVCTGPSSLCGGGNCYTYTVTVHVYMTAGVSDGFVQISGIGDVGDGWSGQFNDCTNYNIAAVNIASGYAFWYWYGSMMYIDNALASSTFFTPVGNGVLILVLRQTGANNAWAGYIESTSTSFTSVTGTFTIPPSMSYVGNGLDPGICSIPPGAYNMEAYWVGIGGVNGGANGNGYNLWQAGVELFVSSSSYYVVAFYETYYMVNYKTGSGGYAQPMCYVSAHAGDTVKVKLSYGSGISSGSITVNQTPWPLPSQIFTPDTSTAEWAVESPLPWAAPNTSPVHFTGCSSSVYGDLQAPVYGWFTKDGYGYPLSPQMIAGANAFDVVYG